LKSNITRREINNLDLRVCGSIRYKQFEGMYFAARILEFSPLLGLPFGVYRDNREKQQKEKRFHKNQSTVS
jgi:hypothetical protein